MILNSNSQSSPNICTIWQPPPARCLKVNTDDAIIGDKGFIRVGVVIRDDSILIVVASSKILVGNIQAKMGELLALREGLLLAKILGCRVMLAEVEACNVASFVMKENTHRGEAEIIIRDIKAMF
ncbi:hypothetical protein Q3G72_024487 [Acer saccharum]|nr:hypothetical protein Q3G72_024487 [Acer saccharum]